MTRTVTNRRDGDTVEFIIFRFEISFLPKCCVKYYDYVVKWCSGVACNWCISLDIPFILALKTTMFTQHIICSCILKTGFIWVLGCS